MAYKIYDNFLEKEDFQVLQTTLMGITFPWFFNEKTSIKYMENQTFFRDDKTDATENDYQFTHAFYQNFQITSNFFSIIDPLLIKINPSSIIRIKANLTTKTNRPMVYGLHVDKLNAPSNFKSAVYYVNTTNGPTIFEDGTEIESIENRLVVFDTNMVHSAVSQTDTKTRVIINLNFYENFSI